MVSPKKKSNPLRNMKGAFGGVLEREFIRRGPELGFKLMPKPALEPAVRFLVAGLVSLFGSDFLNGSDGQESIAELLTFLIPDQKMRSRAASIIVEIIEEAVKNQKDFGDDPEENRERALSIVDNAFGKLGTGDKKRSHATASAQSERNAMHLIGTLDALDQQKVWVIVHGLQVVLNDGQQPVPNQSQPSDEIVRLLNRVTLTREQLTAILAANTPELQQDLLLQALRQSVSAGGAGGSLGRLWDRALAMVEGALPTTPSSGDSFRKHLSGVNKRRKKDDDDLSGIR